VSISPSVERWAMIGAVLAGVGGGIAGLVIGLLAYAPTAWFAVIELGVPCALVGGISGVIAAVLVSTYRRIRRPAR